MGGGVSDQFKYHGGNEGGGENEEEPGLDIDDCPVKTRVSLLCGLLFKTAVAATAEKFCVVNIRLGFSSLHEQQSIVS